ncbi:MAG TPA: TerC family protein, partial [Noviherbaspirillum sp.]
LGWIAGGMVVTDVATKDWVATSMPAATWIGPVVGAILVVVVGKMLAARAQARIPAMEDLAASHDKPSTNSGSK